METKLKKLIENIHPKVTRKIFETHVTEIELNEEEKEAVILVDKKYAFNDLNSRDHIWNVIKWVKKTFTNDYKTVLKLRAHLLKGEKTEHHDREMNTPYIIHYQ